MSVLRTFIVPANSREGFFDADVLTFYGTTEVGPQGIAILTLCDGEPSAAPSARLLGPSGQPMLGAPRAFGTARWRYVVGLEGEAPPVSAIGPDGPMTRTCSGEMQPIGGICRGGGGIWVFVERVA